MLNSEDLATVNGVHSYVARTPFASTNVTVLSGGSGNYTYRLRLAEPYLGRETAVLKHGKAWLPADKTFPLALDRQRYDVEAMRRVRAVLPATSLVTTPEIYVFDEDANVIIMEDGGTLTLKALLLQDGALAVSSARTIGSALGTFLAQVHVWGRDGQVLDFFDGNLQARTLSAWATYGRIVSTLSAPHDLPALRDPPLEVPEDQLKVLTEVADTTADAMRSARETVVHGDFWPGNVMVKLGGEGDEIGVERIYILDWELSKPSLPGFDIGQFFAEVHLARSFYPRCEASASVLLTTFLTAYREGTRQEVMARVAGLTLTHFGAHTVAWTPRTPTWGDKEIVRKVVMDGVRYLLGAGEEEDDLSQSMFGPLLGHGL
ncbi:uncharacterized protein PHACADRAFT_204528 [Phanerochaete carnosa HHB-10118-sp]|uniref:Aminoglycoside phosphotransferase domain-containing protein n=1 Tax=Phanerochaete carnosa (strain HHB-10118-sp) TaxID=650164 RepID=K5WQ68_PHACS|nr:uncharacterized protein PHACADRAFT_204528 [Phanerochaete carnosa HHB-10118-sp]EKM61359.1 hypothetical protein PHACADRAFT_204528 [Phanerochaete carnosa HHB-10118-sp]